MVRTEIRRMNVGRRILRSLHVQQTRGAGARGDRLTAAATDARLLRRLRLRVRRSGAGRQGRYAIR
jgi:hypothetical protein